MKKKAIVKKKSEVTLKKAIGNSGKNLVVKKTSEETSLRMNNHELEEQKDYYAALGYYTMKFEMVCSAIKECIIAMSKLNGIKNERLIAALLFDSTARPLKEYLSGYINEMYPDQMNDKETKIYINLLLNSIQKAFELRNDVIHTGWTIAYGSDNKPYCFIGTRLKVSKNGLKNIFQFHVKKEDVIKTAHENRILASHLMRLKKNITEKNSLIKGAKEDKNNFLTDLQFEFNDSETHGRKSFK